MLAIATLCVPLYLGASSVGAESDSTKPPTESVNEAATKIGHAFRDAAREIGHASRDAWNESAAARRVAGEEAKATSKSTWQSFKDDIRDTWRKVTGSADSEPD